MIKEGRDQAGSRAPSAVCLWERLVSRWEPFHPLTGFPLGNRSKRATVSKTGSTKQGADFSKTGMIGCIQTIQVNPSEGGGTGHGPNVPEHQLGPFSGGSYSSGELRRL